MFSAERRDDGSIKDTPTNIVETGVDQTSIPLASDENEFDIANLTPVEATTVTPPRVAEAKAHFECMLEETLDIYGNSVVFERVKYAHVDQALLTSENVDATRVSALGRIGGPFYTGIDILPTQRDYDPDL